MNIPNTDSRRIKRLDNDQFTVEPLSAVKDPESLICNHCFVQPCKIRSLVQKIPHDKAVVKVSSCAMFVPCLTFSVLHGLDRDLFNTVRIGGAWSDRLKPGNDVALIDTKNGKFLELREVYRVFSGKLSDIIQDHARFNHALLHEISEGLDKSEAPQRLERILKNAYGTNIASGDRTASVIYLKRKEF